MTVKVPFSELSKALQNKILRERAPGCPIKAAEGDGVIGSRSEPNGAFNGHSGGPGESGGNLPGTGWRDVPTSWGRCQKHGVAWYPMEAGCVFCEQGLDNGDQ